MAADALAARGAGRVCEFVLDDADESQFGIVLQANVRQARARARRRGRPAGGGPRDNHDPRRQRDEGASGGGRRCWFRRAVLRPNARPNSSSPHAEASEGTGARLTGRVDGQRIREGRVAEKTRRRREREVEPERATRVVIRELDREGCLRPPGGSMSDSPDRVLIINGADGLMIGASHYLPLPR
jgi:hypothetical protein